MAIFALAPLDINANHNNAPQIRTTRRTAPQSNSNLRKQSDYHLVPKGSTRGLPIAPSSSSEEENVVPLPAQRRRGGVPQQQQQQQEHNKPKEEVVLNSTPQKKPPSKKILCATPPVSLYNKKRNVEYDRGRQLGEGGFARCYLVQNNEGKLFAAKTVAKKSLEVEKTRNKFLGEISVQRTMVHPNIVHFVECFEDDDNIYMILELCPNKVCLLVHLSSISAVQAPPDSPL